MNKISFNNDTVTTTQNGILRNATTAVSDCEGNLLFYTDGKHVVDRKHDTMPNGKNLNAWMFLINQVYVIPKPGNPDLYYIFSNDYYNGISYSVLDMRLNNGFGDISGIKNVPLMDSTADFMIAGYHENHKDFWLVTMDIKNLDLHSFHVSGNGIDTLPVITPISFKTWFSNSFEDFRVKFSEDGNYLLFVDNQYHRSFNLLKFNKSTGYFYDHLEIKHPFGYGAIDFSPDNSMVYIMDSIDSWGFMNWSKTRTIHQYDITSWDKQVIENSPVPIIDSIMGGSGPSLYRLGPDQKIYTRDKASEYIGVIYYPNKKGKAAQYEDSVYQFNPLSVMTGDYSLQNFIFYPHNTVEYEITTDTTCAGGVMPFAISDTAYIDSVFWEFGDPASGAANFGTGFFPTHQYQNAGTYPVTAYVHFECYTDTILDTVEVLPTVELELGQDRWLCDEESVELETTQDFPVSYLWQDGDTSATYTVTEPGVYMSPSPRGAAFSAIRWR